MNNKDKLFKQHNVSSTEEFLNSLKQPVNACPLIEIHLNNLIKLENELDLIINKIGDCPLDILSNSDFYRFYIAQFDEIKEYILDIKIVIENHSSLIESMRGRCLSKREEIKELKELFWKSLDNKILFNEFPYAKEPFFTCVDTFQFSVNEISFIKHPDDESYYDNYLKYIQKDELEFNYYDLKELLENLFLWGNDLSEKMINYSKFSMNQV